MDPIVLKPGAGEAISVAGNDVLFKAEGEHTGGHIGITEYTAAPGFPGPPAHIHREMTDMFYVLDGKLQFALGDDIVEASAGSFVLVPPGHLHTFSNPYDDPSRFLSLVAPAGLEQYFKALSIALAEESFSPDLVARLSAEYDIEFP
jgi:mannose-6-phosphate isomerase-like protein (cupin superfamily)